MRNITGRENFTACGRTKPQVMFHTSVLPIESVVCLLALSHCPVVYNSCIIHAQRLQNCISC